MLCYKQFLRYLQKHPEDGKHHSRQKIIKAAHIAYDMAVIMQKKYPDALKMNEQIKLLAQGIALINPAMRLQLLSGEITPEQFSTY